MYGPRAILACGFTPLEQEKLMKALDNIQLTTLPMTFATAADTGNHLGELLTRPDPRIKEISEYLVHQMLLQETGDGGVALTDTIRRRYEHAMEQRDQVCTKLALSWH